MKKPCFVCDEAFDKDETIRLYGYYHVCKSCRGLWAVVFDELRKMDKYSHLKGWKEWRPIFKEWKNAYRPERREKVIFN